MQLINDLSDLPRYASLLTPEYRQKLTEDINSLLVKYMDEQTKAPKFIEQKKESFSFDDLMLELNPSTQPSQSNPLFNSGFSPSVNTPPPPPVATKPNLMSNLSKPVFPPPPPPPVSGSGVPQGNQVKLKPLFQKPAFATSIQRKPASKFISVFESLGYIMPELNDAGIDAAQKIPVNTEPSKYLKQVDGSTTLKQIYMIIYPSTVSPVDFLERTMEINSGKYINFKSAGNIPADTDVLIRLGDLLIAFGYIDENLLENALILQRRETRNVQGDDDMTHYDAAEARKEDNKRLKKDRSLLGDVLVDMKAVSQQQVEQAIRIQKWYRDIIEKVRD